MPRSREHEVRRQESKWRNLPPDISLQSLDPHAYVPAALLLGSRAQFRQRRTADPGTPARRSQARGPGCEDEAPRRKDWLWGSQIAVKAAARALGSEWGRRGGAALSYLSDSANAGRLRRASRTHRAAMTAPAAASLHPH